MKLVTAVTIIIPSLLLAGCSGDFGAGYWFHILFVLVPFGYMLYKLNRKAGEISESLFKLEGKVDQLSSRIKKHEDI